MSSSLTERATSFFPLVPWLRRKKGEKQMKPRALRTGEGRSYSWNEYLFTVKAGAAETGSGVSFMEFFTRKGDEPGVHVHEDEDEIFYVLEGDLTVTCGDESFDLAPGASSFFLAISRTDSRSAATDSCTCSWWPSRLSPSRTSGNALKRKVHL